jgi:hypothetical protein
MEISDISVVTLVNRTDQTIEGMFDGRVYSLAPREERQMLKVVAEMIKRQNPKMGTEDPYVMGPQSAEFLVGVREWGDDCEPLDVGDSIERFDRSLIATNAKVETVKVPGRIRPERAPRPTNDVQFSADIPD